MRRLTIVIVVSIFVLPIVVIARTAAFSSSQAENVTYVLPIAEELGNGWELISQGAFDDNSVGLTQQWATYGGPEGSRLTAAAYPISHRLSERSDQWSALAEIWQSWADANNQPFVVAGDRTPIERNLHDDLPLPNGINDAIRYSGPLSSFPGFTIGIGLYAIDDGPAIFLSLEGAFGKNEVIESMDIIAAMSALKFSSDATPTSNITEQPVEETAVLVVPTMVSEEMISISARDIYFDPKQLNATANIDVVITVTNEGAATHDFAIPELGIKTELISPGESTSVTVNAPAGYYQFECSVPGHAAAGMVGILTLNDADVTAKANSTSTVTTSPIPNSQTSKSDLNLELNAIDIAFSPKILDGPAKMNFTITVSNKGVVMHNFTIDDLGISVEILPGESKVIDVKAPAGTYAFYCNIPGHKAAGMVGTLSLN